MQHSVNRVRVRYRFVGESFPYFAFANLDRRLRLRTSNLNNLRRPARMADISSGAPRAADRAASSSAAGTKQDGFNQDGFDKNGRDKDGFDKFGYNEEDVRHTECGDEFYMVFAYDENGFDKYGVDGEGNDRRGYNRDGENWFEVGGGLTRRRAR